MAENVLQLCKLLLSTKPQFLHVKCSKLSIVYLGLLFNKERPYGGVHLGKRERAGEGAKMEAMSVYYNSPLAVMYTKMGEGRGLGQSWGHGHFLL